jgi:hypothetical protein
MMALSGMVKERSAFWDLVGKPEGNRQLRRLG